MRNLGTGKRAMNYNGSTAGYNEYMSKLERKHPDKLQEMLGVDFSEGYGSPIEALRAKAIEERKEAARQATKEYKELMKEMKQKQKELLHGEPSKLIL